MAEIRLDDFVLLSCDFEVWPSRVGAEPDEAPEGEAPDEPVEEVEAVAGEAAVSAEPADDEDILGYYPAGDFLQLDPSSWEHEDHYLLALSASLDDPGLPFRLNLTVGSRFFVGQDEEGNRPSLEETESTLVWLSYPYLRETISAITGRSPLLPYYLPAITKLPHPSVTEEE